MLRVNPDGTIPDDNPILPWASGPTAAYSMGHRNPHGLAFDPVTGLGFSIEHAHHRISETDTGGGQLRMAGGGWPG